MRVIVQRVSRAAVWIDNEIVGKINQGLLVLVGFNANDNKSNVDWMCNKLLGLRIFQDENEKMNLSVQDVNGGILLASNFTLYGDAQKGFRPSFIEAARPEIAIPLYEYMLDALNNSEILIQSGKFGAMMDIELVNSGPVTIFIEK